MPHLTEDSQLIHSEAVKPARSQTEVDTQNGL